MKIKRAYTRYYRDNRQLMAYVEWDNGSRTEGEAYRYHGLELPKGVYIWASCLTGLFVTD